MRFVSLVPKCAQRAVFLCKKMLMPSLKSSLNNSPKALAAAQYLLRACRSPHSLPQSYTVANRSLPLRFVPHMRAKRLTLRIENGGHGLRITAPLSAGGGEILQFIRKHHSWLEQKLAALPAFDSGNAPYLRSGGFIPFLGAPHRIIHKSGRGVTHLHEEAGEKQILVYGEEQFLARHIRDFLKNQAEKTIAPFVHRHASAVGRKPKSISYKDTKSRWGSCSSERKLSFSWRIIMAPIEVADYLAAHEVAHLVEMNHSSHFWAVCGQLCPDMERQRAWLKNNGQQLHAILFE